MPFRAAIPLLALLLLQQLPPPFQTPWFRKATRVVAMPDGHRLTVPQGFTVNVFADKLQFARFMALAPNGDVLLAEPVRGAGTITVLRDVDIYRIAIPRRVPQQRFRGAARIDQPVIAVGLLRRPDSLPQRQTVRAS